MLEGLDAIPWSTMHHALGTAEDIPDYSGRQLHPYVARMLAEEPVEVQRAVIGILSILKSIAKAME